MVSRRLLLGATIASLLIGVLGLYLFAAQRRASCAAVPFFSAELLPNADFAAIGATGLPSGWERAAGGVELRGPDIDGQGFDLDGNGRALQLIGIANSVRTPAIQVQSNQVYCFSGYSLTDSPLRSATRVRLAFEWYDAEQQLLATATTNWQPVTLWTPENPPRDWSPLQGAARSPADAASLRVRIEPASDDRIYLDALAVRAGGAALLTPQPDAAIATDLPQALPWPNARRAAVAFTFDWETTMGGLIHSRSVDDPNFDQDPVLRGMRMRQGITTTLALFETYGVRATYYATGYNFLAGNTERRIFMDDPTFAWANPSNGWLSERWQTTPWFADDPYGTIASDPAWYFADLTPHLLQAGHEIQSHTFSHLYGGLADADLWQADLQTWNSVAAEQQVGPARSLAFPWSGSAGMSDANWDALERAGISSVTRLSDQTQYNLFRLDAAGIVREPDCRDLPGREGGILACPDFYLTPERADLAIAQIEHTVAYGGMIDLWAHTEEVVTPAQIAAWEHVVRTAVEHPDVWVAPLSEIADRRQAIAALEISLVPDDTGDNIQRIMLHNPGNIDLYGLTLRSPLALERATLAGDDLPLRVDPTDGTTLLLLDLAAGETREVWLWPA
jgi:peptidoglycan/xylan/chitin deacetylase (PgdA/CDA1 family)